MSFLESVLEELFPCPLEWLEFDVKFAQLSSGKKFSFVFERMRSKGLLLKIDEPRSTKSSAKAVEYKNLGNEEFYSGCDVEAVRLYTRSAAAALPGSVELAIAFANRSAALYRLGRYPACIVDVNRALNGSYPDASIPKLRERKRMCVEKLEEERRMRAIFMDARMNATLFDGKDGFGSRWKQKMDELSIDANATELNLGNKFPLPSANFKNKFVPNTSEKVKINFSRKHGRYVVAAEDIPPGEILSIEKPYTFLLDSKLVYSHCSNCFVRCESLIPCPACSLVMFCSESCHQDAFDQFHRTECQILSIASQLELEKSVWLCFRMLMVATKQGKELKTLMTHPIFKRKERSKIFDPTREPHFHSDDLVNILSLSSKSVADNTVKSFLSNQIASIFVYFLKRVEFFGESNKVNEQVCPSRPILTEEESFFGRLASQLFLTICSNGISIVESTGCEKSMSSMDSLPCTAPKIEANIGSAIYPFHRMYKHTCDVNVSPIFHKNVFVTRTTRPVKAGEELRINYGVAFFETSRYERHMFLRDEYGMITCHCEACKFDWPILENASSFRSKVKGKTLKRLNQYAVKVQKEQEKGLNPDSDKVLKCLREYSSLLHQHVEKPCKEFVECRKLLDEMFSMQGNCYLSPFDDVLLSL